MYLQYITRSVKQKQCFSSVQNEPFISTDPESVASAIIHFPFFVQPQWNAAVSFSMFFFILLFCTVIGLSWLLISPTVLSINPTVPCISVLPIRKNLRDLLWFSSELFEKNALIISTVRSTCPASRIGRQHFLTGIKFLSYESKNI